VQVLRRLWRLIAAGAPLTNAKTLQTSHQDLVAKSCEVVENKTWGEVGCLGAAHLLFWLNCRPAVLSHGLEGLSKRPRPSIQPVKLPRKPSKG
jgi:hypothetical protein